MNATGAVNGSPLVIRTGIPPRIGGASATAADVPVVSPRPDRSRIVTVIAYGCTGPPCSYDCP